MSASYFPVCVFFFSKGIKQTHIIRSPTACTNKVITFSIGFNGLRVKFHSNFATTSESKRHACCKKKYLSMNSMCFVVGKLHVLFVIQSSSPKPLTSSLAFFFPSWRSFFNGGNYANCLCGSISTRIIHWITLGISTFETLVLLCFQLEPIWLRSLNQQTTLSHRPLLTDRPGPDQGDHINFH